MTKPVVKTAVTVRSATVRDAAAVARLSRELGYPTTAKRIRNRLQAILASAADLLVVAENSSGKVVGWLQAHASHVVESGFRVEIVGLIVGAGTRRMGAGRSLVHAAEQWARSIGVDTVVVRSNSHRLESHRFYPGLGYKHTKTQKVYRKLAHAPSGR